MFDFDNPKEDLYRLEDELLEEEEEEYEARPRRRHRKARRTEIASAVEREAIYIEKETQPRKREKGIAGLKFLALLEIVAILAILWGWIKWLY